MWKRFFILLLMVGCSTEDSYRLTLQKRIEEIRSEQYYDNSVVVLDESSGYGSDWPVWDASEKYYKGDVARTPRAMFYEAIQDSKGQDPTESPEYWTLNRFASHRPYLFLRDTAHVEDLLMLTSADHPYLRAYALGALAHRGYDSLFQLILRNLGDTTRVSEMTGDDGSDAFVSELILSYAMDKFNAIEKDSIRTLIRVKYDYLKAVIDEFEARSDSISLAGERILKGESIWGRNEDYIFALMDSMTSTNPDYRLFAVEVFGKIRAQSDGYVGEVIGSYVMKYAGSYPDEFIRITPEEELKSMAYAAGSEIAMAVNGDHEDLQRFIDQVSKKKEIMSDLDRQKLGKFVGWVQEGRDLAMEDLDQN